MRLSGKFALFTALVITLTSSVLADPTAIKAIHQDKKAAGGGPDQYVKFIEAAVGAAVPKEWSLKFADDKKATEFVQRFGQQTEVILDAAPTAPDAPIDGWRMTFPFGLITITYAAPAPPETRHRLTITSTASVPPIGPQNEKWVMTFKKSDASTALAADGKLVSEPAALAVGSFFSLNKLTQTQVEDLESAIKTCEPFVMKFPNAEVKLCKANAAGTGFEEGAKLADSVSNCVQVGIAKKDTTGTLAATDPHELEAPFSLVFTQAAAEVTVSLIGTPAPREFLGYKHSSIIGAALSFFTYCILVAGCSFVHSSIDPAGYRIGLYSSFVGQYLTILDWHPVETDELETSDTTFVDVHDKDGNFIGRKKVPIAPRTHTDSVGVGGHSGEQGDAYGFSLMAALLAVPFLL